MLVIICMAEVASSYIHGVFLMDALQSGLIQYLIQLAIGLNKIMEVALLFLNKAIISIVLALSVPFTGSCAYANQLDAYGNSVLRYASGDMNTPASAVGVVDSLYDIERMSINKGQVYVALLDYYLGSGGGAVLNELITRNGDTILPLLKQKLTSPISCLPEYQSICAKSSDRRNERITRLIEAINSGVVLCVDKSKPGCSELINK